MHFLCASRHVVLHASCHCITLCIHKHTCVQMLRNLKRSADVPHEKTPVSKKQVSYKVPTDIVPLPTPTAEASDTIKDVFKTMVKDAVRDAMTELFLSVMKK